LGKIKSGESSQSSKSTLRFLAILMADLAYLRNSRKELFEDLSEKVFRVVS